MNVQPGLCYGFMAPEAHAALQRSMGNEGIESYMKRVGDGLRNVQPSWAGTANAFHDPYRQPYYEQRYGIHRVWEDVQ